MTECWGRGEGSMVRSCLSNKAGPGTFRFTGTQVPHLNVLKSEFLITLKLLDLLQRGPTANEFVLQHAHSWFCFHWGKTNVFWMGGILIEALMPLLCIFAINAVWFISVLREQGAMHENLEALGLIWTYTIILHSGYIGKCYHSSLKHWLCGELDQTVFTDKNSCWIHWVLDSDPWDSGEKF